MPRPVKRHPGRWPQFFVLVLYFLLACPWITSPSFAADAPLTWTTVRAKESLRGVTAGRDRLVAVGDAGTVLTSTNGMDWVRATTGVTNQLTAVAYDNGEFTAVGRGSHVLRSGDGTNWTRFSFGATVRLRAVALREGVAVACGEKGVVRVRNPAGIWETRVSGSAKNLNGVARSPEATVIVGDDGEILRSTDLVNWDRVAPDRFQTLLGVRFVGEEFVAVGEYGTVIRSKNGLDWIVASEWQLPEYRDVTTLGDRMVVVGGAGEEQPYRGHVTIVRPGTGSTEVPADLSPITGVAKFDGQLLAVGLGGMIARSTDGVTWEGIQGAPLAAVVALTQTPGGWWLTTYARPGELTIPLLELERSNPMAYRQVGTNTLDVMVPASSPSIVRAAELQGRWVATGPGSNTWVSADGLSWAPGGAIAGADWRDIAAGNGRFVAVGRLGQSGLVASSTDGTEWQVEALTGKGALNHVVYGNGRFVAAGDHGARLTSMHGGPWVSTGTQWRFAVTGLAFGNGRFVAGEDWDLFVSRDGLEWRKASSFRISPYRAIEFGGGRFLAVGESDSIASSNDGNTWTTSQTRDPSMNWSAVAWTGDQFVLGAYDGTLAWSRTTEPQPPAWLNEPRDVGSIAGFPATLDAAVSESAPTTYQWYKDGSPIPGATEGRLDLARTGPGDAGHYTLVVSNRFGSLTSNPVALEVSPARPADRWEILRDPTTSLMLDRCASSPERFVATTASGGLAVSTNGYTWSALPSPTTERLTQIRYLENRFVALGEKGFLAQSDDGFTWISMVTSSQATLRDIAFGGGIWVVVGDEGTVLTSPDLTTWLTVPTPLASRLMGVCWTGRTFHAAGDFGVIVSSRDGAIWLQENTQTLAHLSSIAAGSGTVLAVGDHGTYVRLTSGRWTANLTDLRPWPHDFRDVVWWDDWFYAVSPEGGVAFVISNAGAGVGQNAAGTLNPRMFSAVCAGIRGLYAVAGTALMQADRPGAWSPVTGPGIARLLDIAKVAGRLVAVGDRGTIVASQDLNEWVTVPSGTTNVLTAIAGMQGTGVIVGGRDRIPLGGFYADGGILLFAANGSDWTEIPDVTTNALRTVCAGAGRYVVGGNFGTILVSGNGRDWTLAQPGTRENIYGIIHDGKRFMAVGNSLLLESEDGLNWSIKPLAARSLLDPVVTEDRGLAFLGQGQLWHREPSEPYALASMTLPFPATSLAGLGPTLAAVGGRPTVILTRNGSEGAVMDVGQGWNLFRVRSIDGAFYAVGDYGVIVRSAPEARLTLRRTSPQRSQLELSDTGGRPFRVERRDKASGPDGWRDQGPGAPAANGQIWELEDPAGIPEGYFRAVLDEE